MKFTTEQKKQILGLEEEGMEPAGIAARTGLDLHDVRVYLARVAAQRRHTLRFGTRKEQTLCWDCRIASGKPSRQTGGQCPWVARAQPVPGWETEPTERTVTDGYGRHPVPGWRIVSCPIFEQDGTGGEDEEDYMTTEQWIEWMIERRR